MKTDTNQIGNLEILPLARTTEAQYCRAAQRAKGNEFWWYFNGTAVYRGFSKPFEDAEGRWWYRVKAGLAWPVDFFTPFHARPKTPFLKTFLGRQYPVTASMANSQVWFNVIYRLDGYNLDSVAPNKRRAIRKGLRELCIRVVDPAEAATIEAAHVVWNSHVARTRWNSPMSLEKFSASWRELSSWPGTTVMAAIDPQRGGEMCAWLIVRVIGQTLYVDTLASHTERLGSRPNDALIFVCLASAAHAGIQRAHYSLRSRLSSLEAFKASLGFVAHSFPAVTELRGPVAGLVRIIRPEDYRRLLGDPRYFQAQS